MPGSLKTHLDCLNEWLSNTQAIYDEDWWRLNMIVAIVAKATHLASSNHRQMQNYMSFLRKATYWEFGVKVWKYLVTHWERNLQHKNVSWHPVWEILLHSIKTGPG